NLVTKNLDKKLKCVTIFLDLSKAFDSVNHKFLIQKLQRLGFHQNAWKLIESYLNNREQCVKINNCDYSSFKPITCGVPQGSVLGPLLYTLYTNDLFYLNGSDCDIISYADD